MMKIVRGLAWFCIVLGILISVNGIAYSFGDEATHAAARAWIRWGSGLMALGVVLLVMSRPGRFPPLSSL
jgi:hypothetical protein